MENLHNRRKIDPALSRNNFWGAVIAAGASLYSANQNRAAANKANRRGAGESARATESYELLGGYADDWMDRYKEMYAPIEQGLAEDVAAGPDYEGVGGKAATDTTLAYDKAKGGEERRLQRYGIDPSMGRSDTGSELDRARTEVMAKNTAYDREEDKDWARKMAFTQMGRGLEAGAAGIREGIASGYQNMASSSRSQAAGHASNAGSLYGIAGGAISNAIDGYSSGGGGGTSAPTAGVDYGVPTSNVDYGGYTNNFDPDS